MGLRSNRVRDVGNGGSSMMPSPMSSARVAHHGLVAVAAVAAFLSIAAEASSRSSILLGTNDDVEMPSVIADSAFIESPGTWTGRGLMQRSNSDSSASGEKDDIGTKGGTGKPSCKKLGGKTPSAKYKNLSLDTIYEDMEERMERAYERARSNCDDARIVLMGDSIVNHFRKSSACEKQIYSSYNGRGINLGMPGIVSRATAKLARRVFEKTCIAPEVVYLAVGINDCITSNSSWYAAKGIIDSVKIIKGFSPDTRVVVQKVLPTSFPRRDAGGKKWEDEATYECVQRINKKVGRWIEENRQSCISHEDLDHVVLEKSKIFRMGVYDDGIHFWGSNGNMDPYCKAVAEAVERYNGDGGDSSEDYSDGGLAVAQE